MKTKYPYYRVTIYCKTPGVLETWFKHFQDRQVPCAIANGAYTKSFALWAMGTESVEFQYESGNMEKIGTIHKSYKWEVNDDADAM